MHYSRWIYYIAFYSHKFVALKISCHLYFLRISNVWSMLHHGLVLRDQCKEFYFMFTYTFLAFFCCFLLKKLCLYHFHLLFWWSIQFLQQSINQSETKIGGKKWTVELYDTDKSELIISSSIKLKLTSNQNTSTKKKLKKYCYFI